MSSGHWTNTGMAKFINDNLYNYDSEDEKSMNPFRWYRVQNGEDVSNYRETINGFPCRLILVNDGETPLNEGQNEPTPGNTKDMGIFNFNNDKDNVTTLGFDSDIFPNCASYEVTANSDTSAGAFMSFYSGFSIQAIKYTTSYKTIYIKTSDFDTVEVSVATSESYPAYIVNYYDATFTKRSSQTRYMKASQGDTVAEINKSYPYFSIQTSDAGVDFDFLTINGIDYKIDLVESITEDMIYENSIDESSELAYLKESFELRHPDEDDVAEDWGFMGVGEEGTGLKALIDWVDNCTDEEFVNDFEEHFHKDYTLRYYCLVVLCGMVDNMGKNMMLDTADNKIFFPRFYDIDTCCSYDNSGQLKFDVDIEMEQGYWNTSSSRLWTRIRDLMHDDIVTTYNNMRQNGVSYENMMHYIYDEQIAKIPQTYYNKD